MRDVRRKRTRRRNVAPGAGFTERSPSSPSCPKPLCWMTLLISVGLPSAIKENTITNITYHFGGCTACECPISKEDFTDVPSVVMPDGHTYTETYVLNYIYV